MQTSVQLAAPSRIPPVKTKRASNPRPIAERHAAMTDRSGGLFVCWPWKGSVKDANGYGQIYGVNPRTGKTTMRSAHVVAWEVANGRRVPKGKFVLHARGCCKTCQNPAHLRLGTHAENMADAKAEGHVGRRLTKAQVLDVVMLHYQHGVSQAALAHRFAVDHSAIRRILRGQSHSKLTGIEPHTLKGGRPTMGASAVPAPAPLPPDVIILDQRRRARAPLRAPEHAANVH